MPRIVADGRGLSYQRGFSLRWRIEWEWMRFSIADLILGITFIAAILATFKAGESRWALLPISVAIACVLILLGRMRFPK